MVAGKAFWSHIDADAGEKLFDDEDASLLRDIFNPILSDRRQEGDHFAPPGTGFSYVEKLQNLVKNEELIRIKRKEHFLSANFVVGDAGPLFPSSWTTSLEIERGRVLPEGVSLHKVQSDLDVECLLNATPEFERRTEDGMNFRIYKSGSLELRSTQEHGQSEIVGAVFSLRSSTQALDVNRKVKDEESIVKVTEYVKFLDESTQNQKHRYYVVIETEQGSSVVTERLQDGKMTWEENPEDLDDKNSLARVIRSVECRVSRVRAAIADVKAFQEKQQGITTDGRLYAQHVFVKAIGGVAQMVRANNIKAKTLANEREQA
jgi:hypothetical protein